MKDNGWLLLVALIVLVIVIKKSMAQGPSKQRTDDNAGGVKIPPVPEPTHVRGVPIGEAQPVVSVGNASIQTLPRQAPLPLKRTTQSTTQSTKKLPLTGQDRAEWQRKKWEEEQRKKAEEAAARRAAAKQRQAEQEERDKVEKAKSMAAAEARMAEERAKKAAAALRATTDKERDQQRRDYLRTKIPARIQRDMDSFLAGEFQGPEQSPLTYVGYHVGVARGLTERDRIERLEVCFRVPIPTILYAEYKDWGEPATTQRLNAMIAHIGRHAAIRSTQPKYDRAVAEWEADRAWLLSVLGPKADAFSERWLG